MYPDTYHIDLTLRKEQQIPPQGEEWFWFPPDQLQPDIDYHTEGDNGEILPRGCTQELGGCPCVFILGEADDHKNSRAVPFDEPWQWFTVDLFAYSRFGIPYASLSEAPGALAKKTGEAFAEIGYILNWQFLIELQSQKSLIDHAFEKTFAGSTAFTNKKGLDEYANYIAGRNLSAGNPELDKYRKCGTDCSKKIGNVVNSGGIIMLIADSFIYEDGPPSDYGIEILKDRRVAYATNIYRRGAVGQFPRLGAPVPYPFMTKREFPPPLPRMVFTEAAWG